MESTRPPSEGRNGHMGAILALPYDANDEDLPFAEPPFTRTPHIVRCPGDSIPNRPFIELPLQSPSRAFLNPEASPARLRRTAAAHARPQPQTQPVNTWHPPATEGDVLPRPEVSGPITGPQSTVPPHPSARTSPRAGAHGHRFRHPLTLRKAVSISSHSRRQNHRLPAGTESVGQATKL
jgi:hypothetical protein